MFLLFLLRCFLFPCFLYWLYWLSFISFLSFFSFLFCGSFLFPSYPSLPLFHRFSSFPYFRSFPCSLFDLFDLFYWSYFLYIFHFFYFLYCFHFFFFFSSFFFVFFYLLFSLFFSFFFSFPKGNIYRLKSPKPKRYWTMSPSKKTRWPQTSQKNKKDQKGPSACVQVFPALRNTKMSPGMVSKMVSRGTRESAHPMMAEWGACPQIYQVLTHLLTGAGIDLRTFDEALISFLRFGRSPQDELSRRFGRDLMEDFGKPKCKMLVRT